MAKTKTKGSGKLTGLLAFLLGFIFAIIVEAGVIFGVGYYALTTPIDNVFGMIGRENDDGNGNQLIDTTGSVSTLMDLIKEISSIAGEGENLVIGDVIKLSPALDAKLKELYAEAEKYGVYIDAEAVKEQKLSNLSEYLVNEVVMEIRPYELLTSSELGLGGEDSVFENNVLVRTLLLGAEAEYVVNGDEKYVVYYDEYVAEGDGFVRTDGEAYPAGIDAEEWLTPTNAVLAAEEDGAGSKIYRQYFYYDPIAENYVVTAEDEDGAFKLVSASQATVYPEDYGNPPVNYTGNYVTDENGDMQFLTYVDENGEEQSLEVTFATLQNTNTLYRTLHYVDAAEMLTDLMGGTQSEMLTDLMGGITVGDMLEGRVDIDSTVQNVTLVSVMGGVDPENRVMAYLGHRISNVTPVAGQEYAYTATYSYTDEDGNAVSGNARVYVNEAGEIERVADADTGKEVPATTVGEAQDMVNDLQISSLLAVPADDSVLAYLGYGITQVAATSDPLVYSAVYNDNGTDVSVTVTVTDAEDKIISSVVRDDNGQSIPAATIEVLEDRVSGITETLALADFMSVAPSYTDTDGTAVNNNITLFITFSATMQSDAAIASDSYGSYYEGKYIDPQTEESRTARLYVNDASLPAAQQKIVNVKYTVDGTNWLNGQKTTIDGESGVSSQINRVTGVLTIGDLIEIEEDDRLMQNLAGYTLDNVSDALNDIALADAIDIGPDEDIMLYVAFGLTDVVPSGDGYAGTYHPLDGAAAPAELVIDTNGKGKEIVVGIVVEGEELSGTTLGKAGERVGRLSRDMAVTAFVDISADSPIMMYVGYGATEVVYNDATRSGTAVVDGSPVSFTADDKGNVAAITFQNGAAVPGTAIEKIGSRIDGLTSTLTIGELMPDAAQNNLLKLVVNSTIDTLSKDINAITVQEMYAENIYANGGAMEQAEAYNANYVYYTQNADGSYTLAGSDGKLTQDEFEEGGTFHTRGATKGVWTLLLCNGGSEKVYKITELGTMIGDATDNLKSATLKDFDDAEIIELEAGSENTLVPIREGTDVDSSAGEQHGTGVLTGFVVKPLPKCTIKELITAIDNMLTLIEQFGGAGN